MSDNLLSLRNSLVGGLYRLCYVGKNEVKNLSPDDRIFTHWDPTRAFMEGVGKPPRLDYGQIVLITKKRFGATQVAVGDVFVWVDHYEWVACEEVTVLDE